MGSMRTSTVEEAATSDRHVRGEGALIATRLANCRRHGGLPGFKDDAPRGWKHMAPLARLRMATTGNECRGFAGEEVNSAAGLSRSAWRGQPIGLKLELMPLLDACQRGPAAAHRRRWPPNAK